MSPTSGNSSTPPSSDTWEWAVVPGSRRRWLWPAAAAVVLIALVVLVTRDGPTGSLAVGPTAMPGSTDGASGQPSEVADLRPRSGDVLELIDASAGDGPLLADASDLTLFVTDDFSRLQITELGTGSTRRVQLGDQGEPSSPIADVMFVVGDGVVVDVDGDVVLVEDGGRRATRLARDHRAIPTADDDSVWVVAGSSQATASTASLLTLDGEVAFRVPLPAVAEPIAGTGDGLIVATPGEMIRIDVDGARRVVVDGGAIASSDEHVAWLACGPDLSCEVAIGSIDDPDRVRVPLEPGDLPTAYGTPHGEFSPDGRWLALPLYRVGGDGIAGSNVVSIIDTATGVEVGHAMASESSGFAMPLTWSPDSRWLALEQGGRIRMWSADRRDFVPFDIGFIPVEALALV